MIPAPPLDFELGFQGLSKDWVFLFGFSALRGAVVNCDGNDWNDGL